MRCSVITLFALLIATSLCYLHLLTFKEIQSFPISRIYTLPYKVVLSYNGSIIASVNITQWTTFYRLNSTTDLYEQISVIDGSFHVYDIVFAKNSLNYSALMFNMFESSGHLKTFQGVQKNFIQNVRNLGIGNHDETILFATISITPSPNSQTYLNGSLVSSVSGERQSLFFYRCFSCGTTRMVLSGKNRNRAVLMSQQKGIEVVQLSNSVKTYQTLSFYTRVNNGEFNQMALDFSDSEIFIVASIRIQSLTIWMIRPDGYYYWLQTQNLTDGVNNMTIKKLHFTNDEQKLFVATDKQARIYTKRDVSDTRQTFKLSCTIGLSPNSTSDISADGTTVAALSNTSLRIFKVDVDLIMSQIDPTLYAVLFYGLIPVGIILSIFIIGYVFLEHWQNMRNFCRLLGVILRRNPNRQNKYRQETEQVIKEEGK